MRFELFISRRIARRESRSFSRLIIIIARIAIALSLAVMIISSAMVNGFRNTISEKVYGFWGHINIAKESLRNSYDDLPVLRQESFIREMDSLEGVEHVQVYARKAGIIKSSTDMEGIILKGIDAHFYWDHFRKYIIDGQILKLHAESTSGDILLSKSIADRMRFSVGDSVILHFIDMDSDGNYVQRFRKLRVCGIYNTGLEEFDKMFALIDLQHVQRLNNWTPEQVGGYEVFIKNVGDIELLREQLDMLADPFWKVQSIHQIIPGIFDWLNLQKINERIIILLMLIVAVINMITSLLILILERTQMIGILKAIGAANWSIRKIFLYNAAYIIAIGMVFGNVIGIGVCLLQQQFGIIKLPEQSYYVRTVPVSIDITFLLLLNAGTFCICLLCLLLPSVIVSRILPVKAIRFN
ncbi:MAG: ABC transporter permease [Chitinophagales bacterium]